MTDPALALGEPTAPEPVLIDTTREPLPPVVDTPEAYARVVEAMASGTGPVGVDTERAQSFRYSSKAYLIQLRRAGAGTVLLDPVALEGGRERADLSELADALSDAEWILHAASQDLPCLAEVGLLPRRLFDTELGGRLLGFPRVSLSALTERGLGKTLAKEHSAADWSKRPLPESWLNYAALDVELLDELRDYVADELERAGKAEWARQEFAFLVEHADDPAHTRVDPWRRTSGLHDLHSPAQLAVVRELWETRDGLARKVDRAPGRILPDAAITELAGKVTPTKRELTVTDMRGVRGFTWKIPARYEQRFVAALDRAASLPKSELPRMAMTPDGPPPPRTWARRYPDAYARWNVVRPATIELAEQHQLPVENLCQPDAIRRLAFEPPSRHTEEAVDEFLAGRLVRPWQRELVVPVVTPLLDAVASDEPTSEDDPTAS